MSFKFEPRRIKNREKRRPKNKRPSFFGPIPLPRGTRQTLISSELISVQPLPMPSGRLFFLDFVYGRPKDLEDNNLKKLKNIWNRII